jgi:hypothetical protein
MSAARSTSPHASPTLDLDTQGENLLGTFIGRLLLRNVRRHGLLHHLHGSRLAGTQHRGTHLFHHCAVNYRLLPPETSPAAERRVHRRFIFGMGAQVFVLLFGCLPKGYNGRSASIIRILARPSLPRPPISLASQKVLHRFFHRSTKTYTQLLRTLRGPPGRNPSLCKRQPSHSTRKPASL